MTANTRTWLHGLSAAFIGGAAGAIETALILPAFDPVKFNFGDNLKTMLTACVVFGFLSGVKTTVTYLKQSPIPSDLAVQQTVTVSQTSSGGVKVQSTAQNVPKLPVPESSPMSEVLASRETAEAEIIRLRDALNMNPGSPASPSTTKESDG